MYCIMYYYVMYYCIMLLLIIEACLRNLSLIYSKSVASISYHADPFKKDLNGPERKLNGLQVLYSHGLLRHVSRVYLFFIASL